MNVAYTIGGGESTIPHAGRQYRENSELTALCMSWKPNQQMGIEDIYNSAVDHIGGRQFPASDVHALLLEPRVLQLNNIVVGLFMSAAYNASSDDIIYHGLEAEFALGSRISHLAYRLAAGKVFVSRVLTGNHGEESEGVVINLENSIGWSAHRAKGVYINIGNGGGASLEGAQGVIINDGKMSLFKGYSNDEGHSPIFVMLKGTARLVQGHGIETMKEPSIIYRHRIHPCSRLPEAAAYAQTLVRWARESPEKFLDHDPQEIIARMHSLVEVQK